MNWEQKYDALASMIEGYRHERNEALERLRLLEAEVERVNAREDATRRELYATCIDMRDAQRERDEARAEVERLRTALLEVQTSESAPAWFADGFHDGWKAGAKAMREACARWMSEREGISQWVYDDALSALPIPEEP